MPKQHYQVREFAERSGVTIRTLHHYDHLGLLKPSLHTESGYRLYSERDLARLQQIVTLKFIGLSLRQIKDLLDGESFDLATMLRLQRKTMEEKRRQLELAIQAIDRAEQMVVAGNEHDWDAFHYIIEVITMEDSREMFKKYYTDEQLAELDRRAKENPEMMAQAPQMWKELIEEVEQAMARGEDPASDHVQSLAARWRSLIDAFTGGNPEIEASLKKFYADRDNWSGSFKSPVNEEAAAFISKAWEVGKKG